MGFAGGPITFRRFYLCGQHPDSLTDEWFAALAAHAFGTQRDASPDGIETGWIVPNHLFDVDFAEPHRIIHDRFVFLAMRLDRTAAPGAIVQSYRKMEEAAALEASDRDYLSKTERRLAKEAALRRAEKEARAGKFRRTTAYPVLIDFEDGVLYFGSLGAGAADRLMVLFSDTFQTTLAAATAEEVAYRVAQRAGRVRVFEDIRPIGLVDPPAADPQADALAFPGQDRSFLGREFLAWLWYRTEQHEGLFELKRGKTVTLTIERVMHLACPFGVTGSDLIRTDAPGAAPEAHAALNIGKLPGKLGLLVADSADEWGLTIDGPRLAVSSLRVSRADESDRAAETEHRFTQMREISAILDQLFAEFLRLRLDSSWDLEFAAMCRWARVPGGQRAGGRQIQLATA